MKNVLKYLKLTNINFLWVWWRLRTLQKIFSETCENFSFFCFPQTPLCVQNFKIHVSRLCLFYLSKNKIIKKWGFITSKVLFSHLGANLRIIINFFYYILAFKASKRYSPKFSFWVKTKKIKWSLKNKGFIYIT